MELPESTHPVVKALALAMEAIPVEAHVAELPRVFAEVTGRPLDLRNGYDVALANAALRIFQPEI